jgi:5-methylcytosine-specific restriction endonuclease McrA
MKLSIFSKVNYLPKNKDEKALQSKLLIWNKVEYWKKLNGLEQEFLISTHGRIFKISNKRFVYPNKKCFVRLCCLPNVRQNLSIYNLMLKHFNPELKKYYIANKGKTFKLHELIFINTATNKVCYKCGILKSIENFCKKERGLGGKSSYCLDCNSQIGIQYYKQNKKKINNKNRKNYEKNKDKYKITAKNWANKNKDRRNASSRKRSKLNRAYENERWSRRKARQKHAKEIFPSDYRAILSIYERAIELSKTTGIKHEVDHIIPLFNANVCGLHVSWNLQILTKSENSKKGNKLL